jgi:predicted NBD/HSP70 family sugar kinase
MTRRPPPAPRSALTPRALAVTRHLLLHGPATRGHLGAQLRLSEASMSRVARSLVSHGIITETVDARAALGRPRQILTAVPSAAHVVGVKLTENTAYGVACDFFGTVVATRTSPLPTSTAGVVPVTATVKTVSSLVKRLSKRIPTLDGVGISLGGIVTGRAQVQEGTFLGWRDIDLADPLDRALDVPVVLTNDVTALAREQLWFGAGRTHSTFGLITVGRGLGFGVVREGHVVEQLIDNGHLLAHAPLDMAGPACALGHRGCVAAYLNRDDVETRLTRDLGRPISFADLVRDPEPGLSRWTEEAACALGHLVATFAGALQTDRIVLAGEDVIPLVESTTFTDTITDRLRPGPHETQRCTLDVSTAPLTFTDWARGAAVVGLQHILGAL